MIIPINHVAYLIYIPQCKQAQIDKDVIRENTTITDHNYRVGDKVMSKTKSAYKYETMLNGLYEMVHTWTKRTFTLQTRVIKTRLNIRNINPYSTPIVEGQDPA